MKLILPKGFKASGVSCGLKKSGKKDLALIFSSSTAAAVGLFTKNSLKAAPVRLCESVLKNKKACCIVANSGNANCFTKAQGAKDAKAMAKIAAKECGISSDQVLVCSTGIIGRPLDMNKVRAGIKKAAGCLSSQSGFDAAGSILTTDTAEKVFSTSFKIKGVQVRVSAMSKGAGMIFPALNHATMLCFILTDACIEYAALKSALIEAVEPSFNSINIDGCMSTNDSVVLLANSQAANKEIKKDTPEYFAFSGKLKQACMKMALSIVADAEGATKFISIQVKGAKTQVQARQAAFAVSNSLLFKTACFGENPNIGRIVAAIGTLGIVKNEKDLNIKMSDIRKREINVIVSIGAGKADWKVYTSDISLDYVKINAAYN